jgi:hypothetical protein
MFWRKIVKIILILILVVLTGLAIGTFLMSSADNRIDMSASQDFNNSPASALDKYNLAEIPSDRQHERFKYLSVGRTKSRLSDGFIKNYEREHPDEILRQFRLGNGPREIILFSNKPIAKNSKYFKKSQ